MAQDPLAGLGGILAAGLAFAILGIYLCCKFGIKKTFDFFVIGLLPRKRPGTDSGCELTPKPPSGTSADVGRGSPD